jgi:putative membrane protein insertion efficiency factor
MKLLRPLFRAYRVAISPAIGNVCRFEPSCSHYAEEAIERWGFFRGMVLAIGRILRCHPFARAGLDPVPPRNKLAGERA